MALSTITGAIFPAAFRGVGFPGPFRDSNGNIYVVSVVSGLPRRLKVMKYNGSSWSEQDSANRPAIHSSADWASLAVEQVGDTLHIASVTQSYASGMDDVIQVQYHTFRMSDHASSDTWGTKNDVVATPNILDATVQRGDVFIVARTSDFVIGHQVNSYNTMGTDYGMMGYSYGTAGSWTTNNNLNGSVEEQQSGVRAAVGTNDTTHFVWQVSSTFDARSLSSSNTLSTLIDPAFSGTGSLNEVSRLLVVDDAGTPKIVLAVKDGATDAPTVSVWDEDGSDDITQTGNTTTGIEETAGKSSGPNENQGLAFDGTNLYVLWRGSDTDLWYDTAPIASVTTGWGTDTELEDAIAVNESWANYYNNTIGYVVEDATTLKYGELSLGGNTVELAGTIAGVGSVTGDLEQVIQLLTNAPDGTSSITGDLEQVFQLQGATDGVATVTASLDVYNVNEMEATTDGTSTVTGTLQQVHQFTGQTDGVASVTATLTNIGVDELAASTDGAATVTGDLELVYQLQGTTDGSSTVSGDLELVKQLQATVDGLATVSGDIDEVAQFYGTPSGVGSVTAALSQVQNLQGSTDGTSTVTGVLALVYQLAAASDGTSTVTAALELVHQLQAQSDGTSSVTPTLELVYQLQSTPAGTSTVTGTLTNIGFSELASTPAGTSTVTAALTVIGANELEATPAGVAAVTGSLTTEALLSAAPDGTSTVTADLEQLALLTTASDGTSTVSGALTLIYQLSGTSDGLATFTGTLEQVQQLIGSIAGTSTVTADLPIIYQLTSTPTGDSTVLAALKQEVDLRARTVLAPVG